jgi:hypothetical protein
MGMIKWDGMEYIDVAQERAQWRGVVNMVIKITVSKKSQNFLTRREI